MIESMMVSMLEENMSTALAHGRCQHLLCAYLENPVRLRLRYHMSPPAMRISTAVAVERPAVNINYGRGMYGKAEAAKAKIDITYTPKSNKLVKALQLNPIKRTQSAKSPLDAPSSRMLTSLTLILSRSITASMRVHCSRS